jgi:Txe/YoeB family toxin of toxin-antitoxin system
MYKILRTVQAKKDAATCERAGFKAKLDDIIDTIKEDPYKPTQHFERLSENMKGLCSRQINYHNRVIYEVLPNNENVKDKHGNPYDGIVNVIRAWGHKYKKPKK